MTIIPVKTSASGFFLVGDGGLHYLGRTLDHGSFAPCGLEYCVLAQGHATGRGSLDYAVAIAQGVCTRTGEPAVVAKLVGWNASPEAPQIAVQAVFAVRPTQREALIEAAHEAAGRAFEVLGVPIEKADDPLSNRGFDRIVKKLSARIKRDALAATREPMIRLLDQTDKNWRRATDKQLEIMFRQIERAMKASGIKAPPGVVTRLRTEGDRVVKGTRRRTVKKFELEVSAKTAQKDLRAIRRVARDQGNFVTSFYDKTLNENLSRVARETVERGIADGLDNRVISRDLKAAMGGQLAGRTTAYYDVVANSFVNRARSFSSLRTFQDSQIERYIISAVLDEVTTDTCFVSGTTVAIPHGTAPIESLKPGDLVVTGSGAVRPVKAALKRAVQSWHVLELSNGATLGVTGTHPLLASGGWLAAGMLIEGDKLAAGGVATRSQTDAELSPDEYWQLAPTEVWVNRTEEVVGETEVYNLEVEGDPTYFANGVLSHNCRSLDGKALEVKRALDLFNQVQDLADPQDIKTTQPWFAERAIKGGADEGKTGLFLAQKTGPAQLMGVIERSGVGRRDDVGQFTWRVGDKALQDAGVGPPPWHGRCRSQIIPDI